MELKSVFTFVLMHHNCSVFPDTMCDCDALGHAHAL